MITTTSTAPLAPATLAPATLAPEGEQVVSFWYKDSLVRFTFVNGEIIDMLDENDGTTLNWSCHPEAVKMAKRRLTMADEDAFAEEEEEEQQAREEEWDGPEDRYLDAAYEDRYDTDCCYW